MTKVLLDQWWCRECKSPTLTHTADHLLLRRHRNRAELQGSRVDCVDHLSSFRGYRGNSLPATLPGFKFSR